MRKPIWSLSFIMMVFMIALSGCGGRGFVKDASNVDLIPPENRGLAEPSMGSPSAAWSSSREYHNSNGLRLMKAAEGYAARIMGKPGGAGVTVAVLDTGFDLSHPDLDGTLWSLEDSTPDGIKHGTHVAGIIAARRNGEGVHGVAYNARLHAIQVLEESYPAELYGLASANVAAGIASAAGLDRTYEFLDKSNKGIIDETICKFGIGGECRTESTKEAKANIINMSLGGSDVNGQLRKAIKDAAGAGTIMVSALGNDELPSPSNSPANYMKSQANGLGIAVGALNVDGSSPATFSNRCGEVARYCLFAPGSNIRSTVPGNSYAPLSGTSMAAPHVSGAAAVLMAAFPNKSPRQIVERLLWTADENRYVAGSQTATSNVPGFIGQSRRINDYDGFGRLNLERAMTAWGDVRVATSGRGTASVRTSSVNLPPGFAAPSDRSALSNVVVYDDHMFPFFHDLNTAFRESAVPASDGVLLGFLSSLGRSSVLPIGKMADIGFSYNNDALNPKKRLGGTAAPQYSLHFQPAPNWDLTFGQGGSAIGFSNDFILNRTRRTVFQDSLSVNPFAAFVGRGSAVRLDWKLNENTTVAFGGNHGNGYFGSASTWLASVGLTRRIGGHLTIGARHGMLRENDAFLGIQSEGAFEAFSNATTHFFDISMEVRLSTNLALFGGASRGITRGGSPARNSLVSGLSDISAESFLIGSELHNLFGKDHLTLTVESPFRPSGATVRMNIPDAEIADGVVSYVPRTVDLTPEGRETRLQIVYEIDRGWGGDLGVIYISVGGYMRMEPNHNEAADNEYGVAAKMRLRF